jgi:hypothetical protein
LIPTGVHMDRGWPMRTGCEVAEKLGRTAWSNVLAVDKLAECGQVARPSSNDRNRPMRWAKEGSSRSMPETRSRLWMTVE